DPLAASRVPPGNRRRLVRALEVTIGSGRPFSASGPGMDAYPPTPFVLVGLTVPRDDLGPRIAERYRRQMDAGFLDEVAALDAGAGWSRTAREALGYRELAAHRRGECTLDEAIDTAVTRTRRFAVRQQRWFGRDPRIRWFDAPRPGARDGGDGASVQRCAEDLLGYWSQVAAAGSGPAATVDPSCCD
ncbi:MAG TPA: tRNA dimethylallyltransferase, partial [Microthrixaceae bacterium]|nr:tRNA dimethylallyltransferase [Microthrixaceae bacterium]